MSQHAFVWFCASRRSTIPFITHHLSPCLAAADPWTANLTPRLRLRAWHSQREKKKRANQGSVIRAISDAGLTPKNSRFLVYWTNTVKKGGSRPWSPGLQPHSSSRPRRPFRPGTCHAHKHTHTLCWHKTGLCVTYLLWTLFCLCWGPHVCTVVHGQRAINAKSVKGDYRNMMMWEILEVFIS